MGTLLDIEALQIFYELIRPLKHRLTIKIKRIQSTMNISSEIWIQVLHYAVRRMVYLILP